MGGTDITPLPLKTCPLKTCRLQDFLNVRMRTCAYGVKVQYTVEGWFEGEYNNRKACETSNGYVENGVCIVTYCLMNEV